ncbi:MAG: hypothetical protein PSV16_06645 [Flavobacterium sp.]|nr:hypothetical protein [Flavobacterium sp.]
MKYLILVSILFFSCSEKPIKKPENFNEKVVDFVIENADDKFIEISELYDSLTTNIPEDKDEKIILVQILKKKGFKIVNYGRGNFPPLGARIIDVTLKNKNCECVVDKIYYLTISDSLYEMRENIKCKTIR